MQSTAPPPRSAAPAARTYPLLLLRVRSGPAPLRDMISTRSTEEHENYEIHTSKYIKLRACEFRFGLIEATKKVLSL